MAVITVSRELGSNGQEIALEVAKTLGYPLVDKETIGTLLSQYGLINFHKVYDSVPDFWESFGNQIGAERAVVIDMMNRVIQALARRGNIVILGRGSYIVLAGLSDVLHVRIQAPVPTRVARVMEWLKLTDPRAAETLVRSNDRFRAQFIKSVYNEPGEKLESFDIVVNTGVVAPAVAASWVISAARAMDERAKRSGSYQSMVRARSTADLPRDSVLDETVTEVVKAA
jgi:cytidylate kinase